VARLATTDPDGRPHLVPIVFAVDGDTLYSAVDDKPKRSRTLRRIENARARPDVTILVDHYEEDRRRLWWIRLRGRARVLDECEERERALALLREKVPAVPRAAPRRSGTGSGRDRSARMDKLNASHCHAVRTWPQPCSSWFRNRLDPGRLSAQRRHPELPDVQLRL